MKQPVVNCPQCGKIIIWNSANRYRPFCSERCKMIDLGQWATESYRIPESEKQEGETLKKDEKQRAGLSWVGKLQTVNTAPFTKK